MLPDPGPVGKVPTDLEGCDDEAAQATEQEIIAFCRERLAHYKCPTTVVFCEVPKTPTGKVQKFRLRQTAQEIA